MLGHDSVDLLDEFVQVLDKHILFHVHSSCRFVFQVVLKGSEEFNYLKQFAFGFRRVGFEEVSKVLLNVSVHFLNFAVYVGKEFLVVANE